MAAERETLREEIPESCRDLDEVVEVASGRPTATLARLRLRWLYQG